MAKHTPGPWEWNKCARVMADNRKIRIADIWNKDWIQQGVSEEERNANARLIASSPELLEACKEMLIELEKVCFLAKKDAFEKIETPAMSKAKQAIAKAEGGD